MCFFTENLYEWVAKEKMIVKKILFLIDSLQGGGAERALVNLVRKLDPKKYDITVATIYNHGIYINQLPDYVKYKTLGVKGFRGINYICKLIPPKVLHQIFIKEKFDLEVAFLEGISTKIISGGCKNIKKIAWVRIDVEQHKRAEVCFFSREQIINCYQMFNKIAFVGEDARQSFERHYGIKENLYIIRNIFEYEDMIKKSKEECDLSGYCRPIFISVGRLEYQKGYERLLRVHKKLIESGYNHSVIILGEGSLKKKLEEQIRSYGVERTFYLLGFHKNPFKYIAKADWYISSSHFEGFSSVIREATLLETPIIATSCAGVREVLGNNSEFGVLVENSEQGLYEGMKKVLNDENMKFIYGKKIVERKNMFNYEMTVLKNQIFIDDCLKG